MDKHINLFQNHLVSTHLVLSAVTTGATGSQAHNNAMSGRRRQVRKQTTQYTRNVSQRRLHHEGQEAFSEWLLYVQWVKGGWITGRGDVLGKGAGLGDSFPGVEGMYSLESLRSE